MGEHSLLRIRQRLPFQVNPKIYTMRSLEPNLLQTFKVHEEVPCQMLIEGRVVLSQVQVKDVEGYLEHLHVILTLLAGWSALDVQMNTFRNNVSPPVERRC